MKGKRFIVLHPFFLPPIELLSQRRNKKGNRGGGHTHPSNPRTSFPDQGLVAPHVDIAIIFNEKFLVFVWEKWALCTQMQCWPPCCGAGPLPRLPQAWCAGSQDRFLSGKGKHLSLLTFELNAMMFTLARQSGSFTDIKYSPEGKLEAVRNFNHPI